MTAVTSTTNFDYEFDAAKGIQRNNLPPFAQRMRKAADLVWEEGYQQPFIRELGEGTLQRERFAFYLLQDFRYVNDYARVHALGLAKAADPEIMAFMLKVQNGALQVETEVHRSYLASYGITEEQMNNVRQSAFARAYTSNILSIAYGKDILRMAARTYRETGSRRERGAQARADRHFRDRRGERIHVLGQRVRHAVHVEARMESGALIALLHGVS